MLSLERLREIEAASITDKSFNGLKNLISAYRSVARAAASVSKEDEEKRDELLELQKTTREKAKKKLAKAVQKIRSVEVEYQVEDPVVASKTISITLSHMGELFELHSDAANVKKTGFQKSEFVVPGVTERVGLPPIMYPKWNKMKVVARAFFTETLCLLDQSIGAASSEANVAILRFLADPTALKWVMPFNRLSERVLSHLCRLWMSPTPSVRLEAFLALRSFVAVAGFPQHCSETLKKKSNKGSDDEDMSDEEAEMGATSGQNKNILVGAARVDQVLTKMYRALVQGASKSVTFRGTSSLRFGTNCLCELLKLNASVAYRVTFQGIRQLAMVTRQAVLPSPPKLTEKQKKHAPEGALVTWAFLTGCKVWAQVLASQTQKNKIHDLAYPLSTVITAALKLKMTSVEWAPLCIHLLSLLNQLSLACDAHIPSAGFAVTVLTHLNSAVGKARRGAPAASSQNGSQTRLQKGLADVDLLLKLKNEHLASLQVVEQAAERTLETITQHLALLARTPAFAEASLPVLASLKRVGKTLDSDFLRRKVKELVALTESAANQAKDSRDVYAVSAPSEDAPSKYLVLEPAQSSAAISGRYASIEALRERRIQEGVSSEEAAAALERRNQEILEAQKNGPVGKKAKKEQIRSIVAEAKDKGRQEYAERQARREKSGGMNKSGGNKVFKRSKKGGKPSMQSKRFKKA